MKRVTVLAGAGASKAVSSTEFPTTVEFFERLPEEITGDILFRFARDFVEQVEQPTQVDIEMILWALEILRNDLQNLRSNKHITGRLFGGSMINEYTPGQRLGAFPQFVSAARGNCVSLISKINEIVYDLYGYEPTEKELKDNWLELIKRFENAGSSLEIFTTNYDAAIETALDIKVGSDRAKEWRGVRGRVRQKLELKAWAEIGSRNATLTKLHGSVDWKKAGNEIHVGDSNFTGDHNRHAIIYLGFKGKSSASFFSIFHNYFAKAIAESSVIIAIGFAFRDEHMNSIIRENCSASTKVFVINPEIVEFPSGRVTPINIELGFGRKALDQISL